MANKHKTHKGLAKRVRGTGTGKVKHRRRGTSHLNSHSSGSKLPELADIVLDNCVPAGDALVQISGLNEPVGPGSTFASALIVNMLKAGIAERLTQLGKPLRVLTSSVLVGEEASRRGFDEAYDEYRRGLIRTLGGSSDD